MGNKAKIKTRQQRPEERRLYWENETIETQQKSIAVKETRKLKKQQENVVQGQVHFRSKQISSYDDDDTELTYDDDDIELKEEEEEENDVTEEIMRYFMDNLEEPMERELMVATE